MSRKTLKPTDLKLYNFILEKDLKNRYRYGIISSEWNPEITDRLVNGVFDFFSEINIDKDKVNYLKVPGSYELINGCAQMQEHYEFSAIIAVGSIIKGETKHFDFNSQSICNGIAHLNATGPCPIILCLLTDDNYAQALDRSGGKYGNKGYDCARAAVYMSSSREYMYESYEKVHALFSDSPKSKEGGRSNQ